MLRFRRMRRLQKFAYVHASVSNHFNQDRSLSSRHIFMLNRAVAHTGWSASTRFRLTEEIQWLSQLFAAVDGSSTPNLSLMSPLTFY
jgi:hypothetical protein